MIKKLLFSALLGIYLLVALLPAPLLAQDATEGMWFNQTYQQWDQRVYNPDNPDEIFGERYTAAQVQWVIYGVVSFFTRSAVGPEMTACVSGGGDFGTCLLQILGPAVASDSQGSLPLAEDGQNKEILSMMFADRPLSLVGYVKDVGARLNLVDEAYAQETGFGFRGLGFIRNLWQATRNFSYAMFIVVIIVSAFMVMFRVKLSPQTVVTLQSALPRIVIGLVLVTFSYAIAGFLVDMMYVSIGVVSLFFDSIDNTVFGTAGHYFYLLTNGPINLGALGLIILYAFIFVSYFFVTFVLSDAVFLIAIPGAQYLLGFFMLVVLIILVIMLVIVSFKLLLLLIKTFVNVLLMTVAAPIQFTLGVLYPSLGLGTWIKSYLANLAVFPTVGAMFMLAFAFLNLSFQAAGVSGTSGPLVDLLSELLGWTPMENSFTTGWPPLLGVSGDVMAFVFLIISMIIVNAIPKTADNIKALLTRRDLTGGTALGTAWSTTTAPVKWAGRTGLGAVTKSVTEAISP